MSAAREKFILTKPSVGNSGNTFWKYTGIKLRILFESSTLRLDSKLHNQKFISVKRISYVISMIFSVHSASFSGE